MPDRPASTLPASTLAARIAAFRASFNPVLLLVIALPLTSVVAGLTTVAIASLQTDPRLPEDYHWEGWKLDRDFERSQRAYDLNIRATLILLPQEQVCRLTLSGDAPQSLTLSLIHATRPELDQIVRLQRTGHAYEGHCEPLAAAPWRVELADTNSHWSIRQRIVGGLDGAQLAARPGT